ncbi:MAG: MmgE/PrpD family protein, partial [Janthinobacterium lividum]
LVKGCEAQGWLREASGQYEPRALVFHPPGVVGPIGSAVAAGHLLGLDAGRLAHAVGIAASRAGTLLANVGTMTKSLHCGVAAAAGLEAALLAERGFTANVDVLETRQGLAAAFFPESFQPELLRRAGPPFRLVAPGYALKMFPSQYGTHFAITAALALYGGIGPAGVIRRGRLVAPVMPYIDRPHPPTGLDGKFSLQYTTAAALLDGSVGIGTFTDERLSAADMQALLPRIELVMSPNIPARFEGMHVALEVWLEDGRHLTSRCDAPPGSWTGAPVSEAAHLDKVRNCLAVRLPSQRVEQVIDGVARLETLTPDGVRALVALAAAP